jgi:hypothetical protein
MATRRQQIGESLEQLQLPWATRYLSADDVSELLGVPKSFIYRRPVAGILTPSRATASVVTFGFARRTSKPGSRLIEESLSGSYRLTSSLLSRAAATHHREPRCRHAEE